LSNNPAKALVTTIQYDLTQPVFDYMQLRIIKYRPKGKNLLNAENFKHADKRR
jgi:hypothetical protein